MTTGERTFSTTNRTVVSSKPQLIPAGTYGGIIAAGADIGKANRFDAIPYVNVSFEVEGTATKEGGKNRRAFHRLLLGLNPGKDGMLNMDRSNGLTALAKSLGTEAEGIEIVEQEVTSPEGESKKIEYLNPRQVVEWLKSFEGSKLKLRIKIAKGTAEYPEDKNEVAAFMSAE